MISSSIRSQRLNFKTIIKISSSFEVNIDFIKAEIEWLTIDIEVTVVAT